MDREIERVKVESAVVYDHFGPGERERSALFILRSPRAIASTPLSEIMSNVREKMRQITE